MKPKALEARIFLIQPPTVTVLSAYADVFL